MELADLRLTLSKYYDQREAAKRLPRVIRRRTVQAISAKIAALEEGQRDILATAITSSRVSGSMVDKNSYPTYVNQVEQAYRMYDCLCDYGGELFSSVADMRTAFIAGEGISFGTQNKAKSDFIESFLRNNNLNGSKLLAAVLMGELEGKVLFVLSTFKSKDKTVESYVKARLFSWLDNRYVVHRNKEDQELIEKITYKVSGEENDKVIDVDASLYVKLGGCRYKDDQTTTRILKVLTQCENASRATYDLRKNTHLFGRVTPAWKTIDAAGARVINDAIESGDWKIGQGYAGTAELSLLEPTGSAADAIIKDLLCSLRYVASMTGIPIHWLSWPELMSNRATAENFLEVVSAATKKERLIWEESIHKLIERVMHIAVAEGIAQRAILDGDFTVKLPLISLAALKQLVDVWLPLYQDGSLVSALTMMNMLPGVDPDKEKKQLDIERKERMARSPFANTQVDRSVAPVPNAKQDEETETETETATEEPDNER